MPDNDIDIRRADASADLPAVLDFMVECFGEDTILSSREFWRWKHDRNPFGASPVLVAEAEGRIVGLRAFMRWQWQSGGNTVPAVRAVDTVTHPDWRGRGIFTRLTLRLVEEMQEEGVAFVFNTPNARSRPGYLKMGWQDVGRVSLWVRPLRPWRCLRALVGRAGERPARVLSSPPGQLVPTSREEGPGGVDKRPSKPADSTTPVPSLEKEGNLKGTHQEDLSSLHAAKELLAQPDADHFLARLTPRSPRYTTPRTPAYLRWRDAGIPGFQYRALWDLDESGGAALVFRTRRRYGLRELSLSEVLVTPGRAGRQRGRRVLHRVLRNAEADYAVALAPWRSPAARVLLRSGFLPAPRLGPHFTARTLNPSPDLPDPSRRSSWHHSIGDLELF